MNLTEKELDTISLIVEEMGECSCGCGSTYEQNFLLLCDWFKRKGYFDFHVPGTEDSFMRVERSDMERFYEAMQMEDSPYRN